MSDPQMTQITQINTPAEKRDEQTYAAIGAAMAVHSELALLLNFDAQRLDYKRLVFDLRPSASSVDNRL